MTNKKKHAIRVTNPKTTDLYYVDHKISDRNKIFNLFWLITATIKTTLNNFVKVEADGIGDFIRDHPEACEILDGEIKPYFDYDKIYNTKKQQEESEIQDIENAIIDVIGFTGANKEQLIILTANGRKNNKWTNSIHIIVNDGTCYPSGLDQKQAMEDYGCFDFEPDMTVYKQAGKRSNLGVI